MLETWVVGELLKARFSQGLSSNLYFWRDHTGNEVDILIELDNCLIPIEVKSGQTITSYFLKGLKYWLQLAGDSAGQGWLVFGGEKNQSRDTIQVVSWQGIGKLVDSLTRPKPKNNQLPL